ncbi:manganese/iron transport system permease protein [Methylopila capsulata]|uniref:Manganese/iron transport system permease protein n=1 Tax=Methylopila capsulata TaxID=61654 RepID=A0A9W6IVE7_9HYPH|nr:metal ABC transporter permease [Methylopila capsulata]MBM7852695.1 manganese/iron transport system permease protein [Methylopila capsulata]GLK56903.1 membrane protein [Methylopila capsulata]
MSFVETLLSPFQFDFMINALAISTLMAVPMALLSCFLVLKGWSLMGDAISHAVFPGVVIAYVAGLPYAVGAFAAGMTCAVATGFLKDNSRIKQDTVMGVVFSGMFGFGLVLYVKIRPDVHLDHILFGDMLGVAWRDIGEAAVIAAVTAGILGLKWRDFLLHAFDPAQARAVGLRVGLLHYGLLGLISLTVVGALKAVGIILAVAMLIAPGAIAFLLTRRFSAMTVVAIVVAVLGSFAGVYLSFFIDSAPAPTIVLALGLCFIAAFLRATQKAARLETTGA